MALPALIPVALSMAAQFAPGLIRHLAGDKAGAVAEQVVNVAQSLTGADTPGAALEALRAHPELAVQFRIKLAEIELERERAYLADRQDARSRDVAFAKLGRQNWRADVLAVGALVGLVGLIWTLLFAPIPDGPARDVLLLLSGALVAICKDVYAYEFGSSRGSAEKSAMMAPKR